jgi:4-diphosphocytidyl-2-C-methyl-D-erythritol kinase
LPDGRHALETLFAFCTDGDKLTGEKTDAFVLEVVGPFAGDAPAGEDNLVLEAARALADQAGVKAGASLRLEKKLPVASGIGGGSADAAAALRLLTSMWGIDPAHAQAVAPGLGADVPACLLSMTARGRGAGDELQLVDAGVSGAPVLLVNPRMGLSTADVFQGWEGEDGGPLDKWRDGRNGLQASAITLIPLIGGMLNWLSLQRGVDVARMSGSGATCFALFDSEDARDRAAEAVPREWWHLATTLR